MNASAISLIAEVLLLILGIYLYLFARGIVSFGGESTRKITETFRKDNATWMRLLGLALAAIMGLNVFFHVREMLAG